MVAVLPLLSSRVMDPGCPISTLPTALAKQSLSKEGERARDGTEVQRKIFKGGHSFADQAKIISPSSQTGCDDTQLDIHHR